MFFRMCGGGGLLFVALSAFLCAEESGFYFGAGYQGGSVTFSQESEISLDSIPTPQTTSSKKSFTRPQDGAGIQVGYKQFFAQWFGLRYYGFLDYGYIDFGRDVSDVKSRSAQLFNYGLGLDTLWQILNYPNFSFGFFWGGGFGANSVIASQANYTNLQATFDVGLRTNVLRHHGLEVGVKVPFFQNKDFQTKQSPYSIGNQSGISKNVTNIYYNSSIFVGYVYTF